MKEEIKFLYRKGYHLNKEMYKIHLQAVNEWGSIWNLISNTIYQQIRDMAVKKHSTINLKIEKLTLLLSTD
jgi:hypothetical protein